MSPIQKARGSRVIVIGGGVGGLVAAAELARAGAEVTLVERSAQVGGKLRCVEVSGQMIDVGPTVLTMRPVFEQIFADLGGRLEEHLELVRANRIARHGWTDGSTLDLFADMERSAAAIGQFAGRQEAAGFRRFHDDARRLYELAGVPLLAAQRPSLLGMLRIFGLHSLLALGRYGVTRSMYRALGDYFADPRLRQLFARYATYYGSSPFAAPATLNLIAHVELMGVWYVKGGMARIAEALAHLARAQGVQIRTQSSVEEILVRGDTVAGVRLSSGQSLGADAVISNAAVDALGAGLLGPAVAGAFSPVPRRRRSLSALTVAMVAETRGLPLVRHNVFFSDDYAAEFDDIFAKARLPREPTVYVSAQDREDDPSSGQGPERLFLIINAPATGDRDPFLHEETQSCIDSALETLSRAGLRVGRMRGSPVITTPADFERAFPGTGGALYGQATHSWRMTMQRPAARTSVRGLYLAGGTAHPGAGVPMAAIGGRLAASAALEDLASISLSPLRVMLGGTSMVSATTAFSASP